MGQMKLCIGNTNKQQTDKKRQVGSALITYQGWSGICDICYIKKPKTCFVRPVFEWMVGLPENCLVLVGRSVYQKTDIILFD